MAITPAQRPRLAPKDVRRLLNEHRVGMSLPVEILGIRGYYRDTMGKTGVNDRGIYDDAIFVCAMDEVRAFSANTDPSAWRDGIATLKTGTWKYKPGIHGLSKPKELQYMAFVQADTVTVTRDNRGEETGFFGINIHRGGYSGTSSLGCQTIVPDQWEEFYKFVTDKMAREKQAVVNYVLINGPVA